MYACAHLVCRSESRSAGTAPAGCRVARGDAGTCKGNQAATDGWKRWSRTIWRRCSAEAPVAFVPLGTFEHHGWHLPVCFDGIKAHALCERVAQRTGGAVLPTFFYGTGGGHVGYKWTLILPEKQITPILEATLDHLAAQGFKVVVVLTGHYPKEQVDMAHRLAQEAQARHPKVRFLGLTEPEITTPQPGDRGAGRSRGQVRNEHRPGIESGLGADGRTYRRTRSRARSRCRPRLGTAHPRTIRSTPCMRFTARTLARRHRRNSAKSSWRKSSPDWRKRWSKDWREARTMPERSER